MIGYMYLITSFVFFLFGGVMALIMRAELARPGLQFVTNEQYNQLFTMHGSIMLLLFATPLFVGFANVHHAAADRLARRRVPAAEHVQLLAVPVRWDHRRVRVPHPRRCGSFGWFAYAPLINAIILAGHRLRPLDHGLHHQRARHDPRCGQSSSRRSSACVPPA